MSALRRDLVERKLWMVIALLLVVVAAVPLFLLKGTPAGGSTPGPVAPAPAAATPATSVTATHAGAKASAKVARSGSARDPFANATKQSSTTTTSTTRTATASAPSTGSSSGGGSATTAASPSAMVSPSPATSGPSSGSGGSATSTPASGSASASSAHSVAATPVSTTASVTPAPTAPVQSWTVYSVAVRYGKDTSVRLRSNVARLTAFPSASQPQVMFLGVMTGGKQAVFALRSGVGHTGPGLCRPDHTRCSAIVLKARQTEHLTVPLTDGSQKQVILRVVRITRSVTHSRKAALAAYERYSAAGLCDLALADPVLYNLGSGTVTGVPKAVCQHQPAAVPFTPLVATP